MPVLTLEKPRTIEGSLVRAHEEALTTREPIVCKTNVFADDRGWSLMNQMRGVMSGEGQINFSVQYPGVVKAWHRHEKQTDFWLCCTGNIKVGVHCQERETSWCIVTGEKNPCTVVIPPSLWHGAATVGHTPAGLLYYVTHAYDPKNPDEERMPFDGVDEFPWGVQHG